MLQYIKKFEMREGVNAGYHRSNVYPANREGRVGKHGIDKNLTLDQVVALAHSMDEKPNIIVKGGPDAKWYFKSIPIEKLNEMITKEFRDVSKNTMYIIEWKNN